ncbi:MAG: SMC-Scp complex subunit ScpB [Kiritimatiellae bacterium]|nr:SMC-Scp complex subunit ScpB [Kiritimatiellia bacterium]
MSDNEEPQTPAARSLRQVVGALVFSGKTALSVETIRKCLAETPGADEGSLSPFATVAPRDIRDALADIQKDLDRLDLGMELREVAGGYRFQTQPGCGAWVRGLLKQERPNRLSRPALETLAIIAYRQPIAKSELEGIRGVTVDHIIRALMEMHLIRIVGRSELPGRPFLYGTTPSFLEHFGLKSLDELNELDPTLQRSKSSPLPRRPKTAKTEEPVEEIAEKTTGAPETAAAENTVEEAEATAEFTPEPSAPEH